MTSLIKISARFFLQTGIYIALLMSRAHDFYTNNSFNYNNINPPHNAFQKFTILTIIDINMTVFVHYFNTACSIFSRPFTLN